MQDSNNTLSGSQEKGRSSCSMAPFFVGIVAALVVGWWLFPKALFSEKHQPIRFSHVVHVEESAMACTDCHFFNADGSFSGIPTTEQCADCHSSVLGEDPDEIKFVNEYVAKNKEVDWLVYQMQPDNVFFSHAAHTLETCGMCHVEWEKEVDVCNNCHPNVAETDTPPAYYENRLTKYSKETMKMWACEKCHAHPDHIGQTRASNACFVCHK